MAGRSRGGSIIGLVVVVWLLIGLVAAVQRNYFGGNDKPSCTTVSTIAVTILAGPLNYVGANPTVTCRAPQPSE